MQMRPSPVESEFADIPSREFRIWTLSARIVRFSRARHNGFGAGAGSYVQDLENRRAFDRFLPCVLSYEAIPDGEVT